MSTISFTEAKRYPLEVERIVETLNSTKVGRRKPVTAEQLRWSYDCCVVVRSCSFQDVIEKALAPRQEEEPPIEEKILDYKSRCTVYLRGTIGRRRAIEELKEIPQRILDEYRASLEESKANKARWDALSPAERAEKRAELLKELSKSPGFCGISFIKGGK